MSAGPSRPVTHKAGAHKADAHKADAHKADAHKADAHKATALPADGRISLAQQLVQVAQCVQAVQAGRSLADALPAVSGPLRPGVQALTFHALRHLGTTMALVTLLAERPPAAAARALLGASLALLLPGVAAATAGDQATATAISPDAHAASTQADEGATQPVWSVVPHYDAFTVVDQAVNAAHSVRHLASQAGLINACLRRFLRESDALLSQANADWEARWNHPAWWVKRVRRDHPQQWQQVLMTSNQPAPLTLRVNATQVSRDDYLLQLQAASGSGIATGDAGVTLLRSPTARTGAVDTLPGFAEGWFSVQDAAAQVAAPLLMCGLLAQRHGEALERAGALPAQPPARHLRVLDACAAPGGKTAHLLEVAHSQGLSLSLLALEVDAQRSLRITENLQRLRLPAQPSGAGGPASTVAVVVANAAEVHVWWDGQPFDAILLDAPCTASGIGRRHPDVRWLRRDTDVAALVATQRQLLDALWPLLAPGGRMVYCTCSVFKAEGQAQIDAFLARHTDASVGASPGHLLPGHAGQRPDMADNAAREHDGFFYARLDKAIF